MNNYDTVEVLFSTLESGRIFRFTEGGRWNLALGNLRYIDLPRGKTIDLLLKLDPVRRVTRMRETHPETTVCEGAKFTVYAVEERILRNEDYLVASTPPAGVFWRVCIPYGNTEWHVGCGVGWDRAREDCVRHVRVSEDDAKPSQLAQACIDSGWEFQSGVWLCPDHKGAE